jgi:DUF1016 N-terminal domain
VKSAKTSTLVLRSRDYGTMLNRVVSLIEEARRASARTVNALMTATYWLIGRHIVEFEQHGKARAEYGAQLIKQLAADLSDRYGRGFSKRNLAQIHRLQNVQLAAVRLSAHQKRRHCLQN